MNTNVKARMRSGVVSQFGRPRGLVGRAAGWVMAARGSNRRRNEWVASLLDVQPADRILEIGFGPGIAIRELARLAERGRVYGLDHSEVMMRQARRRNAAAVRSGTVDLRVGAVDALPVFDEPLDKILAVNSLPFWPDPIARLEELRALLAPHGRIAIAQQPRCPGATEATSRQAGAEIEQLLRRAASARRGRSGSGSSRPSSACSPAS
jgi:ubiquinone/menaquinone biosynthesis C-methylase UbiE